MREYLNSEDDTAVFAGKISKSLSGNEYIMLSGNLGAGKTTFARALIRVLCQNPALEVPSPTFTLVQTYEAPGMFIWHFDLYRLSCPDEVYELGWEDALSEGLVIVEWPERLGPLIPAEHLDIRLASVDNKPEARLIEITKNE